MCNRIFVDQNCHIVIQDEEFIEGTAYIYILQHNPTSQIQIIVKEHADEEVVFELSQDGHYTICTVNISTDEQSPYYYKDNEIYYGGDIISVQDLLNNIEDYDIYPNYQQYFNICNLKSCYYNVCKKILDFSEYNKCSTKLDKELLYKRDLIQIAISAIEYLIEQDEYNEAQCILDRIVGCNGLCKSSEQDCGCHKNCGCHD